MAYAVALRPDGEMLLTPPGSGAKRWSAVMQDVPTDVRSGQSTRVLTDISAVNREGYDRWAAQYDTYVNSTVAIDDLHFPTLWAGVTGRDVLEIGCGTGRHTLRLAGQGNRVTGLDLSPGMLAIARDKLKTYEEVRLVEADVMTCDMGGREGGGPFDAAVAALVVEHIADLPRLFARIAAVLKPDGELFLSEIHPYRSAGGSGARFVDPDTGEERWLANIPHSGAAILEAARGAGLACTTERDVFGDQALADLQPEWVRYLGKPMIRMWIFQKI